MSPLVFCVSLKECLPRCMLILVNLFLKMLEGWTLTVGSLVIESLPSGVGESDPGEFCRTEAQAVLNMNCLYNLQNYSRTPLCSSLVPEGYLGSGPGPLFDIWLVKGNETKLLWYFCQKHALRYHIRGVCGLCPQMMLRFL